MREKKGGGTCHVGMHIGNHPHLDNKTQLDLIRKTQKTVICVSQVLKRLLVTENTIKRISHVFA